MTIVTKEVHFQFPVAQRLCTALNLERTVAGVTMATPPCTPERSKKRHSIPMDEDTPPNVKKSRGISVSFQHQRAPLSNKSLRQESQEYSSCSLPRGPWNSPPTHRIQSRRGSTFPLDEMPAPPSPMRTRSTSDRMLPKGPLVLLGAEPSRNVLDDENSKPSIFLPIDDKVFEGKENEVCPSPPRKKPRLVLKKRNMLRNPWSLHDVISRTIA